MPFDRNQSRERRVQELLVTFLKEKNIRRLDLLQAEFRKYNIEVSVAQLKQMIEGMKQMARERKEQALKLKEINSEMQ